MSLSYATFPNGIASSLPEIIHRSPMVPKHGLRKAGGGQILPNRADMPRFRNQPRFSLRQSAWVVPSQRLLVAIGRACTGGAEVGGRRGADVAASHFHSTAIRTSHLYHDIARVHWLCTWLHSAAREASSHPASAHLSAMGLLAQCAQVMVPFITCENSQWASTFTT